MAVTVSCPACRSQLRLPTAPPPGAVGRCPQCRAAIPLGAADDHTEIPPTPADHSSDEVTRVRTGPVGLAPGGSGFLAPPQAPDEIGRLGPYRVLEKLGQGGMGAVYRAEEPQLRRQVALKVMLPEFASHADWKARFLREAHAQAAVEHEHVVAIYRADEHEGVAFIAMQLLKGQTLGAALKQNPRPPLREVVRIGREIAEGLAAAHEVGLIHRDIKPGNVWLDEKRRRVKILDFGLARAADADGPAPEDVPSTTAATALTGAADGRSLTVRGSAVGTPAYMSPEQARGQKIDFRTDLFSLGVVLYQMLTGQLPFTGHSSFDVLTATVSHDPPAPAALASDVPEPLSDLVMRLLAKSADERPPSAEAVAEELQRLEPALSVSGRFVVTPVLTPDDPWQELADEEPDPVSRVSAPAARPGGAAPPRRLLFVVVGGAALAAIVSAGAVALKFSRSEAPATKAPDVVNHPPAPPKAPAPKPLPPGYPDLTGRVPLLAFDFTRGKPQGAPPEEKNPQSPVRREYTATALRVQTDGGVWYMGFGVLPAEAAIEIRGRVMTPEGGWAVDPVGGGGPDRPVITIDHRGDLRVGPLTPDRAGFRPLVFSHRAIKKWDEREAWNTLLIVTRADGMDFYVNGEEGPRAVPARGGPERILLVGIVGGKAEVEYSHIKAWDLTAAPKK